MSLRNGERLFESLITRHALVDGSKSMSFTATDVFLGLSEWKLEVEPSDTHATFIRLSEECDFAHSLPSRRMSLVRC